MRYLIFLKSEDGDTTTLTEFSDDPISTYRAGKELLLLLGPYAPLVGEEKWIGARVTAGVVSNQHPPIKTWQSDSLLDDSLECSLLQAAQRDLASGFNEFHAICNFTKGEYLYSSEPFVKWLDNPLSLGLQLLHLLTHPDKSLNWSGCEIAVTPLFFPWMRDATQSSYPVIKWHSQHTSDSTKAATRNE